ncbi:structural maintenance of chromosomes protein 6 isoform X2 [Culicoides brevitarsis]|uniref:structural maintenance of chromosomes protein 6 isoform X2 n=1 Tax=Culicoides brevitarsis TaxID=469753 RepID=UPI00307BA175
MPRRTQNMADVNVVPIKRRRRNIPSTDDEVEHEKQPPQDEQMLDDENEAMDQSSSEEDVETEDEITTPDTAKCGRIEKMVLRNFMCHANLEIVFNEKINLLVGNNGSGKSAIITALAIGLGADARSTNRGKSAKGLIKNGQNSCTIEIHLLNQGLDAYDPEAYGDKIIICRKIAASGGGDYQIKSENGRTISRKKDELTRIMAHLNIQPNNPIVILNQDNARAFLKDSDGRQLFNLFMQATQLQMILDKMNECHQMFVKTKSQYEINTRGLEAQKKDLTEKQRRLAELQGLESLRDKVKELKCELAWWHVMEQEKVKRISESELKKIAAKITELVEIIKNKDNADAEIQSKMQHFTGQIQAKQGMIGEINGEIGNIRQKIDEQNQKIIEQRNIAKRIRQRKERLLEDIRTLESSLEEKGNAESVQSMRARNMQALKKLIDEQDEVQSVIETAKRDVEMLRQTIFKCEEKQESAKLHKRSIEEKISRLQAQYSRYTNSQNDPLMAYDPQMPAFVKRVDDEFRRGGFSKAPRGPLGRYVNVPDKRWRMGVESVLGGLLTAFCVNSDQDRIKLDRLRQQHFPNMRSFQIITQKFVEQVYDTSQFLTPGQHDIHQNIEAPNMMEVLQVSDPVVMNCFIDQGGIENILMCTNDRTAAAFTKNSQYVPQNMRKIICIAPFSEYFPAPNYRSYSLKEQACRYIQVDTQEVRRQLEAEITREKQSLLPVEEELKILRIQHQNTTKANQERASELRKSENALQEVQMKISDLKNFEYPKEDEGEVLRQELEEARSTLEDLDPTAQKANDELKQHEETLGGYEKTLEILKNKRSKVETEIRQIQQESDAESNRLMTIASNVSKAKAEQNALSEEAKAAQEKYHAAEAKLKKLTEEAEKFGSRCTTTLESHVYPRKIAELERKIETTANQDTNLDELERLVLAKEADYAKSEATATSIKSCLSYIKQSRLQRFAFMKNMKSYFAFRVRNKFSQVLRVRDMHGTIVFNYKEEKLELQIAPRGNQQKTNTKALSGGERSYSTVAFLIALWSCCDSPFYFLDEYDVFTDQVNRFIMTKLLIHEALAKGDQYAFLTPQDMSSVKAEDYLTIHRFADPIRGDMGRKSQA